MAQAWRLALVVAVGVVAACGGGQSTDYEASFVDVDAERDILFACAEQETGARYALDMVSPSMQRVVSEWESTGLRRARTSVSVVYVATHGPGIQVVRARERWEGSDAPDPDGDRWVRDTPEEGDHDVELELARAIQTCWSDSRDP